MIDPGASETAAVAGIYRDGRLDIISGEYWYEAPGWTKHRFREVASSGNYIDSFSVLPVDVDGDGYPDIVDVSWFAKKIASWTNPGKTPTVGLWPEATVNACCNIEFAVLADMDNDGKRREVMELQSNSLRAISTDEIWTCVQGDTGDHCSIYWRGSREAFSEERSMHVPFRPGRHWQILRFPIGKHPLWRDVIEQLRVDLFNGNVAPAGGRLRWIRHVT